jgi:two-component system response regulator RegA
VSRGKLLVIDDDADFLRIIQRRFASYGFDCFTAENSTNALLTARQQQPDYLLLDLKLGDEVGLSLIKPLRQLLPASRLVLLTGYASIATAVEAMRQGADDYLSKPADTQTIIAALLGEKIVTTDDTPPMSPERLEWEHIQQTLKANQGNISSTARQLNMHRRTLQRKLKKRPASM